MVSASVRPELETAALEAVETPCDIGRVWDINNGGPDEPDCPNPAEWAALAHDCHLGQAILLCTAHYVRVRKDRRPDQFIKWTCRRCGLIAVSNDELIWNVRRLT